MRKFSAHRIYPVNRKPISFGIVETDDDGTILSVRETGGKPVEEAGLEFYPGIIIPGMVNTHCHLELSHLKGLIPEHTGLSGFVPALQKMRHTDQEKISRAAAEADRVMYMQGISAVGDISNLEITLPIKKISQIQYHTFIEIFGLDAVIASERFQNGVKLARAFSEAGLPHSLSPHAPYSVGKELWNLLSGESKPSGRISMHHDESPEERELLEHGSGPLAEGFRRAGFDIGNLPVEAPDVFKLLEKYLPDAEWILVHNTIMKNLPLARDIENAVYWVLCSRSNLYIENILPDIERFASSGLTVCLGTDSLASNHSLSILDEMKLILETAPGVSFDTVLHWATLNGARALGMEKNLGTIETGKTPGLVNIPIFDWKQNRLGPDSQPVRLI